jgi:hypothetical protein
MSSAVNPEHCRNDVSVGRSRPVDDRAVMMASRPQTHWFAASRRSSGSRQADPEAEPQCQPNQSRPIRDRHE